MAKNNLILIIDYGLGNLNSVARGVSAAGGKVLISQSPKDLENLEKVILPGVGSFPAGMEGLRKRDLIIPLIKYAKSGKKLLGLCLGMQLLYKKGEEFGDHSGLGLIDGTVKLIKPVQKNIKIPHISWNALLKPKEINNWKGTILEDIIPGENVYFVHSFASNISKNTLAQTEYGGKLFCSVVYKGNIGGTQFHPEKSGEVGQKILKNFIEK